MPQNEPGFLSKLVQSGATTFITTIVAALTTYFITSNFKEKEQQSENHEKEKVRVEASAENNSRILAYERKLDSIARENGRLRMQLQSDNRNGEYSASLEPIKSSAVTNSMMNGTWISADGAEIWTFNNGTIHITAANGYVGAIESTGSYQASGGNMNGNLHLSRFMYMPVNLDATFSVSLGSDNNSLIGTIQMNNNTSAMALYRHQ